MIIKSTLKQNKNKLNIIIGYGDIGIQRNTKKWVDSVPHISIFLNIYVSYKELESETLSRYKRISSISIVGDIII